MYYTYRSMTLKHLILQSMLRFDFFQKCAILSVLAILEKFIPSVTVKVQFQCCISLSLILLFCVVYWDELSFRCHLKLQLLTLNTGPETISCLLYMIVPIRTSSAQIEMYFRRIEPCIYILQYFLNCRVSGSRVIQIISTWVDNKNKHNTMRICRYITETIA